jgi:hypothetical protein
METTDPLTTETLQEMYAEGEGIKCKAGAKPEFTKWVPDLLQCNGSTVFACFKSVDEALSHAIEMIDIDVTFDIQSSRIVVSNCSLGMPDDSMPAALEKHLEVVADLSPMVVTNLRIQ